MFSPALGGGGLMDVGVYPVSLSLSLLGEPTEIASLGILGDTGVDENVGIVMKFANGAVAVNTTSIQATTPQRATIIGTKGRIEIPNWWSSKSLTINAGGKTDTILFDHPGEGFQFEAQHVAECLRSDLKESPIVTHEHTLRVMRTLETICGQLGVVYP